MKHALWLLRWILKAAIFFTLFAFALNNQQEASVNLFFGVSWRAPLVLIVLAVFTMGLVVGVLAMVPRWWRARKVAREPNKRKPAELDAVTPPGEVSNPKQRVDLTRPIQTLDPDNTGATAALTDTLRSVRSPKS